jgi:uncharacterized protein YjbI with pentapeptide repeats
VQRVQGRGPIIRLDGADLRGANLSDANLSGAVLFDANLGEVHLSNADLSGANLSGAILRYTDLSDIRLLGHVSELEELAKTLEGASMPDGSKHP